MEYIRTFTYWFVGVNVVVGTFFSLLCIILGARDLARLIRGLKAETVDETDDGRVENFSVDD